MTALPGAAWEQIRQGHAPDFELLGRVAGSSLATLGAEGVASVQEGLRSQLLGAGPLEPLLADEEVTDVAVNGDGSVWVDRGLGMQRVDVDIGGPEAQRRLAVRLAGLAGRRLDETAPYVDGQLPSGVRLHAILPPLVAGGPHLTLRVPARSRTRLEDLGQRGLFPVGWLPLLRSLVARRIAFVISGGTGAGKTTLLGALLAQVVPTSGSSSSRTSGSCGSRTTTSSGWKRVHRTSRAPVRCPGRPSSDRRCGCARTG